MKIAQIAPLTESVPPQRYGGTERIVAYLTDELVRQGHQVTLFASGDSRTAAELVSGCEIALRHNPLVKDPCPYHLLMLEKVRQRAEEFDILHFHTDYLHFPLVRELGVDSVTTLHGRLDMPDLKGLYFEFSDLPFISISNDQRRPLAGINWAATVYHGLPCHLLPYQARPNGGYLAFLGRISPEKRPDRAIEIAARAGVTLKIAAKIDKVDKGYWDDVIAPMVKANPNVEFVGEITEREKADFLGNAKALLFPIDWPEPFGLVVIEAMACGTPVIAFRNGSVPELLTEGVSGFLAGSVEEAVGAVARLDEIDRKRVRTSFETRFTVERMARDYVSIYERLTAAETTPDRMSRRGLALEGTALAG